MAGDETDGRDEVVYRETLTYGLWLWVMIIGLIGLYIAVLIGAATKGHTWIAVIFGIIAVALTALLVNFWRLVFIITESEVVFGFGLVKKSFKRSDIESCEPYALEFGNYLGYGIRSGRDRTIAYNTRNGPGVKMVVQGQRKPYVVSVADPKQVCQLLSP